MTTPMATKHFKNCLGVFQGGGCKALAFVGAYREAHERGVFYSQLAGTSAGSIVAALIAAGASPDYLERAVLETDFRTLIRPADNSISGQRYIIAGTLTALGPQKYRNAVRFLQHLGLFSSAAIEIWLEGHLANLLGTPTGHKVTFEDLNVPLHVVATEVGTAKPAIWNLDDTPRDSVAHAVRCSCTIPFFFQPVRGRFVDGGVVSNLPAFALSRSHRRGFEKILCFTFAPSANSRPTDPEEQDPQQYLLDLVASIIDGGVSIQSSLQDDLHVVQIGELPLGTLDFSRINPDTVTSMFAAGVAAAKSFFDSEPTRLQIDGNTRPILRTEPETLNQIVREDVGARDEIWMLLSRTRYVYNLFPTLLHWRLTGAALVVVTRPLNAQDRSPEAQHERFRRLVLRCLGTRLIEAEPLPFEGFFFRRDGGLGNAVILDGSRDEETLANFAAKYDRQHDFVAINTMLAKAMEVVDNHPYVGSARQMELVQGGLDPLTERLRTIEQYRSRDVTIDFEEVDVGKIVFLTKYVKSYKYGQIWRLFDIYKTRNFRLFDSVQIQYTWPHKVINMPVTPPVAEEHDGRLFLLEGNSRLTYLIKEQRASRVYLLVIRNVSSRLPTTGQFKANQLLISDEAKVGSDRYEGWTRADYRPIEAAARAPHLYTENYV